MDFEQQEVNAMKTRERNQENSHGDTHLLYRSMPRVLARPQATRVFVCHDYPPKRRQPLWETTVAEQRAHTIHIRGGLGEELFVATRTARDTPLDDPTLILPGTRVNMRAGHLAPAESNGVSHLRIPLNVLAGGANR